MPPRWVAGWSRGRPTACRRPDHAAQKEAFMTFTLVLTLLLAVLIGVSLGLLGGGGSILTVPILTYVAGLPPKEAIAASLRSEERRVGKGGRHRVGEKKKIQKTKIMKVNE